MGAPCTADTQSRNVASARVRSALVPPHQYAMSCSTQHRTHPSSGHIEQPSVVKWCGGVTPRVCVQTVWARRSSASAAAGSLR